MRPVPVRRLCFCVLSLVAVGCTAPPAPLPGGSLPELVPGTVGDRLPQACAEPAAGSVSVLLVGDVMLGRGITPLMKTDPAGVFEGVRFVVAGADLAAANLESPLTMRPHTAAGPFALEADPAGAAALARSGFDLMAVANNHAGDAGRLSILDTIGALEASGLAVVGGGAGRTEAEAPRVFELDGISVGFLAFDATRDGLLAGADEPGIAHWDHDAVRRAVTATRRGVDLLIVSVHGGVEHNPGVDPIMASLGEKLVEWGAHVVWGHGAHVGQAVTGARGPDEGAALIATSLGNFLFDQTGAGTQQGVLLEVLAGQDGLLAYRLGRSDHSDGRVRFDGWRLPDGDAVLLGGEWWNLIDPVSLEPAPPPAWPSERFIGGDVVEAARGDVTGDGFVDLVVSHRRPHRVNGVNVQFPGHRWADRQGRSAHLGVYDPAALRAIWVAGTLFRPIAHLAVCEGSVALAFDSLDDPDIVATGGWVWDGFGFRVSAELPGPGRPGCSDVDGDGRLDPVIVDRS